MVLDYNRLDNNERKIYDAFGEENTLRIIVHAFQSACIRAEILSIDSKNPKFTLLQKIYRTAVVGIFAQHAVKIKHPEEYIFIPISEKELREVELARSPEDNTGLLKKLNKLANQERQA